MSPSSQLVSTTTRLASVLALLCIALSSPSVLAPVHADIAFLFPEKDHVYQLAPNTRSAIEVDAVWKSSPSCMAGGAILELWRLHVDGQYYFTQIVSTLISTRRQEGHPLGYVSHPTLVVFNDVKKHYDDDVYSLRVVTANCDRFSATFRAVLQVPGQHQRPPLVEGDPHTQPAPIGENSGRPNELEAPASSDDPAAGPRSTVKVLLAIFIPMVLICTIVLVVQRFQVKKVSLLGSEGAFDDDIRRLAEQNAGDGMSDAPGPSANYDPEAVAAAM